jgi:zinc protease
MRVLVRTVAIAAAIACVRAMDPWNLAGQAAPAPPRPTVGALTPAPPLVPVQTTLANGVRLVTLIHGHTPKALIQVVVETGAEQPDQCRLTRVLAEIFRSGTESLSGSALTDSIAHMGGALAVSARPEGIELTLEVLTPYSAPAIELLGRIVRAPRLDTVTTSMAVQAVAERGPRTLTEVSTSAEDAFRTALFPGGEFGRPCTAAGARATAYTPSGARHFYAARATGRRTTVYVVGQFSRASAASAVTRAFGGLPRGEAGAARTGTGTAPAPSLQIVERPGAKQVALIVGERVPGPSDSDYARLRVADALLGGSLISRITVNIREAHGYAYAPASDLVATPSGEAYWAEATNVAAPVAWPALREIIKEVARLGVDAPADSELLGTQRYMIGRTLVTRATRAGALDALEAADAGAGGSGDDARQLLGVTPSEVRRVVGSYIVPRDLTIVLAGDTTAIGAQIADLRRGVAALRAGQPDGAR